MLDQEFKILLAVLNIFGYVMSVALQISETKQTEYCLQWLARNAGKRVRRKDLNSDHYK